MSKFQFNRDLPCLTCRWADVPVTRHRVPRVDVHRSIRCTYPIERIVAPAVARTGLNGFHVHYNCVWATSDWLKECRTYEPKEQASR